MAEAASRRGRSRRPLNALSANDVNISAGKAAAKEKRDGLAVVLSPIKNKKVLSTPFADELQDLQRRLEQLHLEKEKTEELLRQRDEMLRQKEEEIENRGREQERLQQELKKLQKLKEFKPTMSIPFMKSLREKEQEKKDMKKKKKNKDCPEKKKPLPAYILWCKDQWSEVKKENPDADFKEISNALGARWNNLSSDYKKPYEERYQQDKAAYLQIMGQEKRENEAMRLLEDEQMQKTAMELLEQYLQFKQDTDKEVKKVRKVKDPLKPKKPMSAFFLFSKERRAALLEENKSVLEIAKIAGEEWKIMTEEKRAPYVKTARMWKKEFDRQMEIYKQKKREEAVNQEKDEEQKKVLKQEALQLLRKKEKTETIIKKIKEKRQKRKKLKEEQNSDPNKPKKPASSFFLFSKEARKQFLQERPGISNSTLCALISVKWKELTEAEKKIWNDKVAEGKAAYKRQMEEYNRSTAKGNEMIPNHGS